MGALLRSEPIAIVGVGCRFPSAPDVLRLWDILRSGRDVLGPLRDARRLELNGTAYAEGDWEARLSALRGGWLEGIDQFDADVFDISPREAQVIDPQQRLLLETTWEAIEDAGQDMRRLDGGPVGVFVGVWGSDYQARLFRHFPNINIAMTNGGGRYAASGRISYAFGFEGPSVTIDTACSSSLVAVHLACQALRAGECSLAVAAGVNVILDPAVTLGYLNAGALSLDGRCKFGDATADGYVRSEGVGVLILKTLRQAREDNDPIHAIIRASVVSHTGQTGGSLFAPGEAAQRRLFARALSEAGVTPTELDYFEAHGTGTRVGDRVELRAIGEMLREGRSSDAPPCLVGSIKTNIGHTESAAGIAGIIKTMLCLKHRQVPPSLNFTVPNPDVAWDQLPLRIATQLTAIGSPGRPTIAAVNSFGITGTFSQVILEDAGSAKIRRHVATVARSPSGTAAVPPTTAPFLLPLSARSPEALQSLARSVSAQLRRQPSDAADIVFSAALRRTHREVRLAAVGASGESLIESLDAFVRGEPTKSLSVSALPTSAQPKVGWVFSGQGPQWPGMGRTLYRDEPAFRCKMDEIDALVVAETGFSTIHEINAESGASRLDRTEIAQPAIFCIQVALAALLTSWGLRPSMIVGHSVGELAAAHVAGLLTLEDAVRVICARARIAEKARGFGNMAAVELDVGEAEALIGRDGAISIAAINGPRSLTLSGPLLPLKAACAGIAALGRFTQLLDVDYPFHSALLDPLVPEMTAVGETVPLAAPHTDLYSTVLGRAIHLTDFGGDYWSRNFRDVVLFAPAIAAMADAGCDLFVEISPQPVLSYSIKQVLKDGRMPAHVVSTLRRDSDGSADLRQCVAEAYIRGSDPDWATLAPVGARPASLPAYPWRHESYWIEEVAATTARTTRVSNDQPYPFLQQRLATLGRGGSSYWQTDISLKRFPWLADHRVRGSATFPAAAYVLAALNAAHDLSPGARLVDLTFHEALLVPESGTLTLQLGLSSEVATDGAYNVTIEAAAADQPWISRRHVSARAVPASAVSEMDLTLLAPHIGAVMSSESFYAAMGHAKLHYGACFQGVETLIVAGARALARVRQHAPLRAGQAMYGLHPATLDACLQALVALTPGWGGPSALWLPQAIDEIHWIEEPPPEATLSALAFRTDLKGASLVGDILLVDENHKVLVSLKGVHLHKVESQQPISDIFHEVRWDLCPHVSGTGNGFEIDQRRLQNAATAVGPTRLEQARIRSVSKTVERVGRLSILHAFNELGFDLAPGRRFTLSDILEEAGIARRHERLLARLLIFLRDDGILQTDGQQWWAMEAPSKVDLDAELGEVTATADADLLPFWRLFTLASLNCAAVLSGRVDAVDVLFGGEGNALLAELYTEHLFWRAPIRQLARALSSIVEQLPRGQTLRILEIGAGTGGLTRHLLPLLPRDRTEYVFTDCSPYFLTRARERFADFPILSHRLLDIEQDPLEQGFEASEFDVVIAANCLHATIDLRKSVEYSSRLLKPGGVLLLQEETIGERWTDLIFGLTDGWWRFEDEALRPHHPLLDHQAWTRLLGDVAFDEVAVLGGEKDSPCGASAIIARKRVSTSYDGRRVKPWLLLGGQGDVATQVFRCLEELGQPCRLEPFIAQGETPALDRILNYIAQADEPGQVVVDLRPLDAVLDDINDTASLVGITDQGVSQTLGIIQHLINCDRRHPPRLVFVTSGSQATSEDQGPVAVVQAVLWNIACGAALEHPGLSIGCVDCDAPGGADAIQDLAKELLSRDSQPEIALRRGRRLTRRLYRCDQPDQDRLRLPLRPFSLAMTQRGALDRIEVLPGAPQRPTSEEVQIRVAAAGLNFRDLLNVLGAVDEVPLGLECSGVVTAIGTGVRDVAVGDAVVAVGLGSWRSHFTTPASLTAPKPARLSHEGAAALPLAYLTAHYALRHLAQLRPGQRVLVHSAAGGVGLALLHMAVADEAEVIGTAGNATKRAYVLAQGATRALDSRSLLFVDDIRSIGPGTVDVVVNSLTGDFIPASLDLLAEGGTFIEIGKRGIWSQDRVASRRPDVVYHVVDLADSMRRSPDILGPMLRRVVTEIEQATLPPLPIRAFPMSATISALRFMQDARQIGKIILVAPALDVQLGDSANGDLHRGAMLITGGFGGLGRALASWLADKGARSLIVTGRGAPTPEASEEFEALRSQGVEVCVEQCDMGDERGVAQLIARCGDDLPDLRGVFHLAGLLDDAPIHELAAPRFLTVYGPKVLGAWTLHRLTKACRLDHFVLFSSWTALLGSPGQANHTSANAFLDALAHHRRAQGLPAQSINWGGWREIGAAAQPHRLAHLARLGMEALGTKEAFAALEQVMSSDVIQVAVGKFDPIAWQASASSSESAFLSALPQDNPKTPVISEEIARETHDRPLRDALLETPAGLLRRRLLESHISQRVAHVLRTSAQKLDTRKSFRSLGLDSLTGLELRNVLEVDTELKLSASLIFNHVTIANLAASLAEQLNVPLDAEISSAQEHTTEDGGDIALLLRTLQDLPAEEAMRLLETERFEQS